MLHTNKPTTEEAAQEAQQRGKAKLTTQHLANAEEEKKRLQKTKELAVAQELTLAQNQAENKKLFETQQKAIKTEEERRAEIAQVNDTLTQVNRSLAQAALTPKTQRTTSLKQTKDELLEIVRAMRENKKLDEQFSKSSKP